MKAVLICAAPRRSGHARVLLTRKLCASVVGGGRRPSLRPRGVGVIRVWWIHHPACQCMFLHGIHSGHFIAYNVCWTALVDDTQRMIGRGESESSKILSYLSSGTLAPSSRHQGAFKYDRTQCRTGNHFHTGGLIPTLRYIGQNQNQQRLSHCQQSSIISSPHVILTCQQAELLSLGWDCLDVPTTLSPGPGAESVPAWECVVPDSTGLLPLGALVQLQGLYRSSDCSKSG